MDSTLCKQNLHLARRQQCACLIQEIGSKLQTTQVVINSGIFYMHHFYQNFSPETFKPILVAIACSYIACKTEDFSRKLSLLIKASYDIMRKPMPDESSDLYKRIVINIHALESTILMVIGFRTLEVKQPHVVLVTAIRKNHFPKEISHTSYYVCTNLLHLTPLILDYSAEAIAAASLYVAAKWNSTEINCSKGEWYTTFHPDLKLAEIKHIAEEFTLAFHACDLRIKEQLRQSLRCYQSRKLERQQRDEMVARKSQVADSTKPDNNRSSQMRTGDHLGNMPPNKKSKIDNNLNNRNPQIQGKPNMHHSNSYQHQRNSYQPVSTTNNKDFQNIF